MAAALTAMACHSLVRMPVECESKQRSRLTAILFIMSGDLPSPSGSTSSQSAIATRHAVESLQSIDLIGRTAHQITGAKLPSNRQVLQTFFYNMRFVKLPARDSASLTINAVSIFWRQARIPMRYEARCIDKLIKMYEQWKGIQKVTASKRTGAQKRTEHEFVAVLDDLFDIAAVDALEQMRIEEDRQFLILQRQKGRPGCMAGVDMVLYSREKRRKQRIEKEMNRKRKHDETMAQSHLVSLDNTEDEEETLQHEIESMDLDNGSIPADGTRKNTATRGTQHFITSRLAFALDNAKVIIAFLYESITYHNTNIYGLNTIIGVGRNGCSHFNRSC